MKILALSKPGKMERYITDPDFYQRFEITVIPFDADDDAILAACPDADIIVADAISKIGAKAISGMPNLKMIHSEGVAYNGFDLAAAKEHGVYVCNCKAMNATAVAEQAIFLMLACLRGGVTGDAAVREGRQMDVKMNHMVAGDLKEIADCKIGFIGFGDIAKATAKYASMMGAEIYYYKRSRLSPEEEKEYQATYLSKEELLSISDIVTLHAPVTEQTKHMVNKAFLNQMKEGAYLINTARGELVDSKDLLESLASGHLAGAGLDCLENEPVALDNEMLQADSATAEKIVYSPHVGGITASSFVRGYKMVYEDIMLVADGKEPKRIVNL